MRSLWNTFKTFLGIGAAVSSPIGKVAEFGAEVTKAGAAATTHATAAGTGLSLGLLNPIKWPLIISTVALATAGIIATVAGSGKKFDRNRDVPNPDRLFVQPVRQEQIAMPELSGRREVLGPFTARHLGVAQRNPVAQPDLMHSDGTSPVDGKALGALGNPS